MQVGIIDIGSNTIKAFVYKVDGKRIETIDSKRFYTHLYSHIENSKITLAGIEALCRDVEKCKSFLVENNCNEIYAFATAALRDSNNSDEALKSVKTCSDINVELISGEEEAVCDIYSMKYVFGLESAFGMDMGGGSAQIFRYDNDEVGFSVSLPLGALKIKELHVSGKFPNKDECEAIKKYVFNVLSPLNSNNTDLIYAMGGSIVELAKIFGFPNKPISIEMLESLKKNLELRSDLEKYLHDVAPGREYTIIPAIITLCTIAEYFGASEYIVLENGVREGYLYKKILK